MNTITFYLEDDNNEDVDFNGETLTYTLQMIKFYSYTFTDLAEVLSIGFKLNFEIGKLQPNHIHDRPDSIKIKSDNNSLITKLTVRHVIRDLRFDDKSFFTTVLGFSPF